MTVFNSIAPFDIQRKLHINGSWVEGHAPPIEVRDPATGDVITTVSNARAAQATLALDAAVAAQERWARTPARARSDVLRRAFDLLRARQEDFARLITLEMGKPLAESRVEVTYANEFLRWFGEEAVRIAGRSQPTPEGTGRMLVTRRPVGPCYLVTPWNFPLAMATRKIAPALAAGCTAVIKPAELTPLTTLAFTALLVEAGLPPGVLNVIVTDDPESVSEAIMTDPRLRKVSFTGSTRVGTHLLRRSAEQVLRTSMELGGNAPFVVFDDADLGRAVEGAMAAKFRNVGQACTAANRFLVQDTVADEFVARLCGRVATLTLGPGTDDGVDIGPLITSRARENAIGLVDDAVERGAVLRFGGRAARSPGHFMEPTLIDHVTIDMAVSTEEIFAPIIAVQRFSTEDEAVSLANATEYGLVSYVWTTNMARADRMVELIETGMMGLNVGVVSNAAAPFGGVKRSGLGREGGPEGIGEYLETKYTVTPDPFDI